MADTSSFILQMKKQVQRGSVTSQGSTAKRLAAVVSLCDIFVFFQPLGGYLNFYSLTFFEGSGRLGNLPRILQPKSREAGIRTLISPASGDMLPPDCGAGEGGRESPVPGPRPEAHCSSCVSRAQ